MKPSINNQRFILCSGVGCNRYALLKLTVEHTIKTIPVKKVVIVTNDKRNFDISFHGMKPDIVFLETDNGTQINYSNFIASSVAHAVNDPSSEDDDIILFKAEDLYINDIALFHRALKKFDEGYGGVLKYHTGADDQCYSYDVGMLKVSAAREIFKDYKIVSELRHPDGALIKTSEQFLSQLYFKRIKSIYQVIGTTQGLCGFVELGFFHMASSLMYVDPTASGWDKRDYDTLYV